MDEPGPSAGAHLLSTAGMATSMALTASPDPGHPAFICSGSPKKGSAVGPGLGSCVWGRQVREHQSLCLEAAGASPGTGVSTRAGDAPGRKEQSPGRSVPGAGASPGLTASRGRSIPGREGASPGSNIPVRQQHPRAGALLGQVRLREGPSSGTELGLRRAPPARAVPVGAVWEEPPGTAAPAPPPAAFGGRRRGAGRGGR